MTIFQACKGNSAGTRDSNKIRPLLTPLVLPIAKKSLPIVSSLFIKNFAGGEES